LRRRAAGVRRRRRHRRRRLRGWADAGWRGRRRGGAAPHERRLPAGRSRGGAGLAGGSPVSRLIIVSNRVNPSNAAGEETVGGLAMALSAALCEYFGLWFGWSGKTAPAFTGALDIQILDGVTTAVVDLEEADLDEYYNGYANKTLWP